MGSVKCLSSLSLVPIPDHLVTIPSILWFLIVPKNSCLFDLLRSVQRLSQASFEIPILQKRNLPWYVDKSKLEPQSKRQKGNPAIKERAHKELAGNVNINNVDKKMLPPYFSKQ